MLCRFFSIIHNASFNLLNILAILSQDPIETLLCAKPFLKSVYSSYVEVAPPTAAPEATRPLLLARTSAPELGAGHSHLSLG